MRRIVVVLVVCVAASVALLTALMRKDERARRGGGAVAVEIDEPREFTSVLDVRDGVAYAPRFEPVPPATPSNAHFFVGRAVSAITRKPVRGAAVVLETTDGKDAWAQPPTGVGGRFRVKAEALGELRVVITSDASEVGVAPAKRSPGDVTDLGTVLLGSSSKLSGRVLERDGRPIEGVGLQIRRFEGLVPLRGVLDRAVSDEHGNWTLDSLPRGLFVVKGEDSDGRTYVAAPVTVPRDGELILHPIDTAPLGIVVRNTAGEPVPLVLVEAIPRPPTRETDPLHPSLFLDIYAGTTDQQGRARIEHLPPGPYWLYVTLANGAPFEWEYEHVGKTTRLMTVATDTVYPCRLVEKETKRPIARQKLKISLNGTSSVRWRGKRAELYPVTDDDGRVNLPRIGSVGMHLKVETLGEFKLVGWAEIGTRKTIEAWRTKTIAMMPAEEDEDVPARNVERTIELRERRARVRSAAGVPVKGAKVYVQRTDKSATNEKGVAALGKAGDHQRCRLKRPDLASGDPSTEPFGERESVDLVWNEGRVVVVRVTDALDGFRLDRGVQLGPRASAWKRLEPGVFMTRWDSAHAPDDAKLSVRVKGYEPWEHEPPDGPGEPMQFDVEMHLPLEPPTATLRLEVLQRNRVTPGVVVRGHWLRNGDVGTRQFTSMTNIDGRVEERGLQEGVWQFVGELASGPWGRTEIALARGVNEIQMNLDKGPKVIGVCIDDRKRPLAGVRIRPVKDDGLVIYSDERGRFGLKSANLKSYVASKTGYRDATFTRGRRNKFHVVLPRLCAIDLPVRWAHGSGPIPDDVVIAIIHRDANWKRTRLPAVARIEKGRLRAEHLPPGHLSFAMLRGSAWAKAFSIKVAPGQTHRRFTVQLRAGGTIKGRVERDNKPVPGALVYVRGRGTRTLRVNERGEFEARGFAPGHYSLHHPRQAEDSARANQRLRVDNEHLTTAVVELR